MIADRQTQDRPPRGLLLVNTRSRRGQEDLSRIRQRLVAGGLQLHEPAIEGCDLSEVIRRDGPAADLIILGGGDGTINQGLAGLLDVQRPLGVLPLGTANDLARTLGLPTDPLAACDIVLQGRQQRIDVGRVNERLFVNVASIGLAVEVTRQLSRAAKTRWGVLAYAWAAIRAILRGRPFAVEICCDGACRRSHTWQVAVGNGRSYGGGWTIHEKARIDDGLLDLCSLEVRHSWDVLPLLPALRRGTLDPVASVRTLHGRSIEVRTLHRIRSITADGELVGHTPAVFSVLPAALSIFVPPASGIPASAAGHTSPG